MFSSKILTEKHTVLFDVIQLKEPLYKAVLVVGSIKSKMAYYKRRTVGDAKNIHVLQAFTRKRVIDAKVNSGITSIDN